jgi:hypothetical protein
MDTTVPVERITSKIYLIRGQKVMLDRDLADLYGVETKVLKQAVRRNIKRFPKDFMFELTTKEFSDWRSQFVTSKSFKKGIRYKPMAFTEQGVAMLSSKINSDRAVQVNIQIVRTFTQLRQMLSTHDDLKKKIEAMEKKYDQQFQIVFEAIKQLLEVDEKPKKKIELPVKKDRTFRIKWLQKKEFEEWNFHARDRDRPWIFQIKENFQYKSNITGHEFNSKWLRLEKDGTITVKASQERPYAWDGCSYKIVIGRNQFIFGSPDGYQDIHMDLPITGKASLVHDAFYQYLHVIPVKKAEVDKLFRDMLKEAGFALWPIYYIAVKYLGGLGVKQKGI